MVKVHEILDVLIENLTEQDIILGYDQYSSDKLEYPECYAMLITTLFYKYQLTNDDYYWKKAESYINRLKEISLSEDSHIWWGLPFNWGETNKCDGFLITTSFVLNSLSLWYNTGKYLDFSLIKGASNWILSLFVSNDTHGFYYSKKLRTNIYNATSIAIGSLSQISNLLSNEDRDRLHLAASSLVSIQKSGYWNYSKNNSEVDLLHQSYTCEGLFQYSSVFNNENTLKSAIYGVNFIMNKLKVNRIERYLFSLRDKEKIRTKIKHLIIKILYIIDPNNFRFSRPRAWSYAAYIRVLIYTVKYDENPLIRNRLIHIIEFVHDKILSDTYVRYSENSPIRYVRNECHMLASLAMYEYYIETGGKHG
ncbi:MAG: hypothetical protein RBQ97_10735 [Acholeplasma sp.]|nr:hypothetical protein [Acholeplasma sp.]